MKPCFCIKGYKEYKPEPCDSCLRVSSIVVDFASAPSDGDYINIDLNELVKSTPDGCDTYEFGIYSKDDVFSSNTVVSSSGSGNQLDYTLTVEVEASTTATNDLKRIKMYARCIETGHKVYFDIDTPIV